MQGRGDKAGNATRTHLPRPDGVVSSVSPSVKSLFVTTPTCFRTFCLPASSSLLTSRSELSLLTYINAVLVRYVSTRCVASIGRMNLAAGRPAKWLRCLSCIQVTCCMYSRRLRMCTEQLTCT
jgi:hypothetical protein